MPNFKKRLVREAHLLEKNPDLKGQMIDDLLLSMKMKSGHIHRVFPDNEETRTHLMDDLFGEVKTGAGGDKKAPDEVIFKNRQAIGDILCFTAAVRDFKLAYPHTNVGVLSTAAHIWDHNPYIDHQLREGNIVEVGPGFLTNKSNSIDYHLINAFRLSMEQKLGLHIPPTLSRPDIWLTEEEINRKPLIDGPYWVLIPSGAPGWPAKQYHRWQEVVDGLKDKIKIVQAGIKGQYPLLNGTEDFTGRTQHKTTGIRDLFNLFYHSQGSMGLVSLHMHLSAAFNNPCVVVGGAREPVWFVHYANHQFLSNNGCLPCATKACWACKLEGCRNLVTPEVITEAHISEKVPKCVDMIHPNEVIAAVQRYYRGGILEYGKKVERPKFPNIVKEKKVFIQPQVNQIDNEYLEKYGMTFGGGAITDRDWLFMSELIEKENIKNILEFGTGLSTLLFQTRVDRIDSFETNQGWINKISAMADETKVNHHNWDGVKATIPQDVVYDFVFVDGPSGGENREFSHKYAYETGAKWIIVHDAGRVPERKWQEKYLSKEYELFRKGGHRCHLWHKKETIKIDDSKPLVRICSTMRGFGGSERSTLELMKGFLDVGYNVEYIPTGNVCGPYLNSIPSGAFKGEWDRISEPCDIFVFYSSDTIWSFDKEQYQIMNNRKANWDVMILNYKIGQAGVAEWTKTFDQYLFLNRTLETEILKRIPDANTSILAPPTNLDDFLKVKPDYEHGLRIVRHSSQRDSKWPDYSNQMIEEFMRIRNDVTFAFMPPRSDCKDHKLIRKFKVNEITPAKLLSLGNIFWYHLPPNYTEGGPRVVMEAMAAGLPVITDNHSGMKDRVTEQTGWLCNDRFEYFKIIESLTPHILRQKGKAARYRAQKEFTKDRWIKEITSNV